MAKPKARSPSSSSSNDKCTGAESLTSSRPVSLAQHSPPAPKVRQSQSSTPDHTQPIEMGLRLCTSGGWQRELAHNQGGRSRAPGREDAFFELSAAVKYFLDKQYCKPTILSLAQI